jgi:aminoglycoside phosphotransferase (APT) family kinase protein
VKTFLYSFEAGASRLAVRVLAPLRAAGSSDSGYGRVVGDRTEQIVGQGRSSVVYDLSNGTVLRRYRDESQSAHSDAVAMRAAAAAGVRVPGVHSAAGPDLVMDAVKGPTMLADLLVHPDRAERYGGVLADLHRGLDRVPFKSGAGLVHGDLHPGNVLMSADGAVLVDWTNSRWAQRSLDVAITWVVLACFGPADPAVEAAIGSVRVPLLNGFLAAVDRTAAAASLWEAAGIRHGDPATLPEEHNRIDELCLAFAP